MPFVDMSDVSALTPERRSLLATVKYLLYGFPSGTRTSNRGVVLSRVGALASSQRHTEHGFAEPLRIVGHAEKFDLSRMGEGEIGRDDGQTCRVVSPERNVSCGPR